MESSNTDDQSKIPNAPPEIELVNNNGPYPPLKQIIPPVSVSGTAYPPYQPVQTPSSPYCSTRYQTAAVNSSEKQGYAAGYPSIQMPNTAYSITQTTVTPSNQPSTTVASYANQLPYPPVQSFCDPSLTPYGPRAQVSSYPPQTYPTLTPYIPGSYVSSYSPQIPYPLNPAPPHPLPTLQHYPFAATPYPPQNPAQLYSPTQQVIGIIAPPIGLALEASTVADALHHQGAPSMLIELGNPTVRPASNFKPEIDAKKLRDTLQLPTPNKDILINILCHRSLEQRLIIANKYYELTGETLFGEIKTKFESNFQKIMLALITPLIDFYVQELHEALEMYDFDSTIDIMCLLSNYEMYTLKYMYEKKYAVSLETKLESNTSIHLKRFLLELCACRRDESGTTNLAAAQHDARQLALQEDPYDNDKFFYYADIFSTRNFQQIKLISEEFQKCTGESLEKTIKSKFFIDDKQGYLCIVRYSENKHAFFAKRLHRSMEGIGTNDSQLIRLIVTRCEIDLQDIKERFQKNFRKSLRSWIKGDTSGHYKYCLYELIGEKRSN